MFTYEVEWFEHEFAFSLSGESRSYAQTGLGETTQLEKQQGG